jgi:hypothetical protein
MKSLILIGLTFASQFTFATTVKKLTAEEFKNDIKMEISNGRVQGGQLSDIDGDCDLSLIKDEKGNDFVAILSDERLVLKVYIGKDNLVKLIMDEDSDGSFTKVYHFGRGQNLTTVHADDAYDSISLEGSETKLTCRVEY